MKRPKFFEDLDRSIAGEPEIPEPAPLPSTYGEQLVALMALQRQAVDGAYELRAHQANLQRLGGYSGALGGFLDGILGGRR